MRGLAAVGDTTPVTSTRQEEAACRQRALPAGSRPCC